jgi:BCCIP
VATVTLVVQRKAKLAVTMGKRQRDVAKETKPGQKPEGQASGLSCKLLSSSKPAHEPAAPDNADEDYIGYASDGSDAARVIHSDSENDLPSSSSDGDIPLGPVVRGTGGGKDGDGDEAMSDVEVSFEFFDPVPADARPVGNLLVEFARETKLEPRPLAEAIVAQTSIGTCVKITDDPAPVAFVTCLNVSKHQKVLKGLLQCIVEVGGKGVKGSVSEMVRRGFEEGDLPANRMGLVITERVVNLPPMLVAFAGSFT